MMSIVESSKTPNFDFSVWVKAESAYVTTLRCVDFSEGWLSSLLIVIKADLVYAALLGQIIFCSVVVRLCRGRDNFDV